MSSTALVPESLARKYSQFGLMALLAGGLFARLLLAHSIFLNPDEALHYFLSCEPSLAAAYRATLTTAHPPLMIVLLHFWQRVGSSEIVLRLPFVIAGTAFCWIMFRWLQQVSDRPTALIAISLLLFSPTLISLSAEIRQYPLLLLFSASSLYFFDRALAEHSIRWMLASSLALVLSLLTHFSALIFAASLTLYALLRLAATNPPKRLVAAWSSGQAIAVAIFASLLAPQVRALKQSGLPQEISATWLRNSIFYAGQDHLMIFAFTRTVRLFRYFYSHGTIGVLGLVCFVLGIILLLSNRERGDPSKPAARQLAVLLVLPFVITLGTAIAGLYPYGGTRHDSILVVFAMAGAAIGIARLDIKRKWVILAGLASALLICNLFPFPTPPYIRARNQNKKWMVSAIRLVRQQAQPGSVLVTDYAGGLLLSYYFCAHNVVELEASQSLLKSRCGDYDVITPPGTQSLWTFDAHNFPAVARDIESSFNLHNTVLLFQAGWVDSKDREWLSELNRRGCASPQRLGENILICPLSLSLRNY